MEGSSAAAGMGLAKFLPRCGAPMTGFAPIQGAHAADTDKP